MISHFRHGVALALLLGALTLTAVFAKGGFDFISIGGPKLKEPVRITDSALTEDFFTFANFYEDRTTEPADPGEGYMAFSKSKFETLCTRIAQHGGSFFRHFTEGTVLSVYAVYKKRILSSDNEKAIAKATRSCAITQRATEQLFLTACIIIPKAASCSTMASRTASLNMMGSGTQPTRL